MKKISLTQSKFAMVDDEDYELVSKYKWIVKKDRYTFYAYSRFNCSYIAMHRLIMQAKKGQILDHINRKGLDNRKFNLSFVNGSQNRQNSKSHCGSSKFKGVSWKKRNNRWESYIKINGNTIHLGHFKNEVDAAIAYDKKAIELFDEFARTNILENP